LFIVETVYQVEALNLQVTLAARDKDAAVDVYKVLQNEHDRVTSQQTHWDNLHRTSEQIETLTALIGQADNEEIRELKRIRDRSNKLESEHTALQKRVKDQDGKVANSERAAVTARQTLAQAQQRAKEWERRAKEHEGELEITRTKLDQADQTHAQLDADYSLVKLQLEEQQADDRLAKVCSALRLEFR
jgi:chromosome segregation ATPase